MDNVGDVDPEMIGGLELSDGVDPVKYESLEVADDRDPTMQQISTWCRRRDGEESDRQSSAMTATPEARSRPEATTVPWFPSDANDHAAMSWFRSDLDHHAAVAWFCRKITIHRWENEKLVEEMEREI